MSSRPERPRRTRRGPVTAVPGAAVSAAIGAAARRRNQLGRVLQRRYPAVAVTGMTGVGKTVLVDRLCRRPLTQGSAEVGSAVLENRTRRGRDLQGFRFRVVPGENAATRLGALDAVFHDDPVDGVLHVVADGRASGRRTPGRSTADPVDRADQLRRELDDWTVTAHRIAAMAVRRERPTWLIVVVTKVDLYPDRIDEVVRYYSPGSGSPFGDRLDELLALTGAAKLSVDVLPVCSLTEGEGVSTEQSETYLAALEQRMAQLSGHL